MAIFNNNNLSRDVEKILKKSHSYLELKLLDILKNGPMTRDQLVKELQRPRTTIYDGLRKLMIRREIKRFPVHDKNKGKGRPKVAFALMSDEEKEKARAELMRLIRGSSKNADNIENKSENQGDTEPDENESID
ncbi:MAG: helix-turn-helix domain-containing protein [Promethearchaeota archaeon]